MDREQIEAAYRANGLTAEYGQDEPGKVYQPHRHEKTYLYTLAGSIRMRLDHGSWAELLPGQEFVVGSNQLHEAVVGTAGWEYIAAWDEAEARHYTH